MIKNIFVILISLVCLIAILATETLYNQPLFEWSTTTIANIQAGAKPYQFTLWELYSTGGLVVASAVPIVVPLVMTTTQRPRAVYYVVFLAAVFLVMNITKLAYFQARPFWISSSIVGPECSN